MNRQQAKNIEKHLRIARATTGDTSEKHYEEVERLVKKYGIIIPKDQFSLGEAIQNATKDYINDSNDNRKKVFYRYNEFSGWRFYWKALINGDWKSFIGHIKDIYFRK